MALLNRADSAASNQSATITAEWGAIGAPPTQARMFGTQACPGRQQRASPMKIFSRCGLDRALNRAASSSASLIGLFDMFRNIETIAAKIKRPVQPSIDCLRQRRKIGPPALPDKPVKAIKPARPPH